VNNWKEEHYKEIDLKDKEMERVKSSRLVVAWKKKNGAKGCNVRGTSATI